MDSFSERGFTVIRSEEKGISGYYRNFKLIRLFPKGPCRKRKRKERGILTFAATIWQKKNQPFPLGEKE